MFLLLHRNPTNGRCYPSIGTIAEKMECSRSKAIRAINELRSAGILHSKQTHLSNEYTFSVAPPPQKYVSILTATWTELHRITLDTQKNILKFRGMDKYNSPFSSKTFQEFEAVKDENVNAYLNGWHEEYVYIPSSTA
jgi:DNA-binding transcriptional MocR family regulator